jgi:hypothetical protein
VSEPVAHVPRLVKILLHEVDRLTDPPQFLEEPSEGHRERFIHELIDISLGERSAFRKTQSDHQIDNRVLDHLREVHRQAIPGVDLPGFFGRVHRLSP